MKIESQYQDVLQNLEIAIVSVYDEHPVLSDSEVSRTLQSLSDKYVAEKIARSPRDFRLSPLEQLLESRIQEMAEWRLGRIPFPGQKEIDPSMNPPPLSADEIIDCIERVRKSVTKWNKREGVRGYLNFIKEYVA